MITSRFNLTLLLGLAAFFAAPTSVLAQENKGGVKSTEGVEVKSTTGTAQKIGQSAEDSSAKGNKGRKKAAGEKYTKEQRTMMREVAREMGRYRANTARLNQVRTVATKKNNEELLAKANEMEPKLVAQHDKAMADLRAKYGDKQVNEAIQYLDGKSRGDVKGNKNVSGTSKKKAKQQNEKVKGKGKQKQKHRKDSKKDS